MPSLQALANKPTRVAAILLIASGVVTFAPTAAEAAKPNTTVPASTTTIKDTPPTGDHNDDGHDDNGKGNTKDKEKQGETSETTVNENGDPHGSLVPFVSCSWQTEDGWVTVFGYKSDWTGTLSVGESNYFTDTKDQGQPTSFTPGVNYNAVVVTHAGDIAWNLAGAHAVGPDKANRCKENPMPITGNPWSSGVWVLGGAAVFGIARLIRRRRIASSWS